MTFPCDEPGCDRTFDNAFGLTVHKARKHNPEARAKWLKTMKTRNTKKAEANGSARVETEAIPFVEAEVVIAPTAIDMLALMRVERDVIDRLIRQFEAAGVR